MSAYSPPTRRIPSCSSDYPQCEAKAHTLFPLPSHQIKTQNLSFLKRHRQIFSFRVLKRQFLLPFAQKQMKTLSVFAVALHPEGVDRNSSLQEMNKLCLRSPSTRRAWIEMLRRSPDRSPRQVALHPEGVDRNCGSVAFRRSIKLSPSTRRAWIEIVRTACDCVERSRRPPPGGRG